MTPRDLVACLLSSGVVLHLDGDRVAFTAPRGQLSLDLREALARNRPYLRDRLGRVGGTPGRQVEERARRAQEELRAGRNEAGQLLSRGQRSVWRLALEDAQADRGVFAPPMQNRGFAADKVSAEDVKQPARELIMPTRDEIFPSRFLKAADLGRKAVTMTVKRVVQEELDEQVKSVVYFLNQSKALVLNATNYDSIAEDNGQETDNWPGAKVELYETTVLFRGKRVPCIRVRTPQRRLPPEMEADAPAGAADSFQ